MTSNSPVGHARVSNRAIARLSSTCFRRRAGPPRGHHAARHRCGGVPGGLDVARLTLPAMANRIEFFRSGYQMESAGVQATPHFEGEARAHDPRHVQGDHPGRHDAGYLPTSSALSRLFDDGAVCLYDPQKPRWRSPSMAARRIRAREGQRRSRHADGPGLRSMEDGRLWRIRVACAFSVVPTRRLMSRSRERGGRRRDVGPLFIVLHAEGRLHPRRSGPSGWPPTPTTRLLTMAAIVDGPESTNCTSIFALASQPISRQTDTNPLTPSRHHVRARAARHDLAPLHHEVLVGQPPAKS